MDNTLADYMSRNFSDNIKWELNQNIFDKICKVFGKPDLFVSRLNNKLDTYISWAPEPGAWKVDAFSVVVRLLFVCISSFQSGQESAEEDPGREGQGNLGGPGLGVSALVWYGDSQQEKAAEVPKENKQSHPTGKAGQSRVHVQLPVGGITFLAKKLRSLGYDKETIELITDTWRPSTKRVYTTYLKKWALFCIRFRVKLLEPSLPQVCKFLKNLTKAGLGYGALNADRSALAKILPSYEGYSLGKHPLVC